MTIRNKKKDIEELDLAGLFSRAGEYHRLVSGSEVFCSDRTVKESSWGPLSPSLAESLGVDDLAAFFKVSTPAREGGRIGISPDGLERINECIDRQLEQASKEEASLFREAQQAQNRLARIEAQKVRLEEIRAAAEVRLSEQRAAMRELEGKFERLTAQRRAGLSVLEKQIKEHIAYFKRVKRSAGVSEGSTGAGPKDLARRRADYYLLKSKLDSTKANFRQGRAHLDTRAAHMARLALKLEKRGSQVEILNRHEEQTRSLIEDITARLEAHQERSQRLKRVRADLDRAGRIWNDLRSRLHEWPKVLAAFQERIPESVDFDTSAWDAELKSIDTELKRIDRAREESARRFKKLWPRSDEFIRALEEFEAEVEAVGAELDNRAVRLEDDSQGRRENFDDLTGRLRNIHRKKEPIISRQAQLARQFRGYLRGLKGLNKRWKELVEERTVLARKIIEAIESRQTSARNHAGLVDRYRGQLAQVYSALPPLIGVPKLLDRGLQAGAVRLARIRHILDISAERLDSYREQWAAAPYSSKDEDASLIEEGEYRLNRWQSLDRVEAMIARLPGQLAAYRDALMRNGEIARLEAACHRSQGEADRLAADKKRLRELLGQSRLELRNLAREKDRLSGDLDEAWTRASDLVEEKDRLANDFKAIKARAIALAKDRKRLNGTLDNYRKKALVLVKEKDRLAGDLTAARGTVTELRDEKDQLTENLKTARIKTSGLAVHLQEEVYPLVETLGLALYQGRTRIVELERQVAAKEKNIDALTVTVAQLKTGKQKAEDGSLKLIQAMAVLSREEARREKINTIQRNRLINRIKGQRASFNQKEAGLNSKIAWLEDGKRKAEQAAIHLSQAVAALGWESARREKDFSAEKERLEDEIRAAAEKAGRLNTRIKELETRRRLEMAAHKKEKAALNLRAAEIESGKRSAQKSAQRLSQALVVLAREREKSEAAFQAEHERLTRKAEVWTRRAKRLTERVENMEAEKVDTLNLIGRQSKEIQAQQDRLGELYPLLSFFMERLDLWVNPPRVDEARTPSLPEGSEFLVLMIHILRQENEGLKEQFRVVDDERQSLRVENDHLARSHEAIKAHLNELLPVFRYFWQAWLTTTSALAETRTGFNLALGRLKAFKAKNKTQAESIRQLSTALEVTEQDLSAARQNLARTEREKETAIKLQAQFKALFEQARAEAEALEQTRLRLTRAVVRQNAGIKTLKRRNLSLSGDKKKLEIDVHFLRGEVRGLEQEVENFTARLNDETNRSSVLWTSLTHLATYSRDTLTGFQSELTAQAETIHALERQLDERARQVSEFERAQDRLGLLFWIITKYGGANEDVLNALIRLTREKGFKDAAEIAGARIHDLSLTALEHIRSDHFRRTARGAVRRGLYSLLLAGGMIFAQPREGSKATALQSEMARPPAIVKLLSEKPSIDEGVISGTLYSEYVGRPCDVSFLTPWERAKGFDYVQEIITREMDALALRAGLAPQDYLNLVRRLFKSGQTVSIGELQDDRNAFKLLGRLFPNISGELEEAPPNPQDILTLYRLSGLAHPVECRFWDRIFADYRRLGAAPLDSLSMVMNNVRVHLDGREQVRQPEFVGRLAPIPELEKLDLAGFTRVITPYVKANIRAMISRPAFAYAHKPDQVDGYARQLAQDMYVAADIFNVPLTMMVSIAHQETYFANVLGDNSMSASPFQIYQPTKPFIIKAMAEKGLQAPSVPEKLENHLTLATYMAAFLMSDLIEKHTTCWGKDNVTICDLDRVALSYNGGPAYPPAVHQKKLRLMGYLDRIRQVATQKQRRPRS